MVVTNLTLSLAHGGYKPYTETCSWWWQTLHWVLLMVVTNLTLRLAHDGNECYSESCSCWWQSLHRQWDYIGKLLKWTETWKKLTKSKRFSCFETKLKQALEKVKIPGPISSVSKYWNNKLIQGNYWNRLKHEENWLSESFSCFEMFRNKIEKALEKVKIPGPISGVSKQWNNKII